MSEKLYIKLNADNQPEGHPHFESNIRQLFPDHDLSVSAPSGWIEFERVSPPVLDVYEKFDDSVGADISGAFNHNGLEYAIVDGICKDVWHVLPMTTEERTSKIEKYKEEWALENPGVTSWTFNETLCMYEPPVPYPDSDDDILRLNYVWDESKTNWVAVE